ncbi:Transcriptional repressor CTCF [Chelonia mydas]|uniref:Transcriptional repressor CTCF n=1 Tax=Chelonia mydas TaxID=8469 RepID=M7C7W0_CHEMY|nr:Transcriptional repressor CTCF [Chelonia mydas]
MGLSLPTPVLAEGTPGPINPARCFAILTASGEHDTFSAQPDPIASPVHPGPDEYNEAREQNSALLHESNVLTGEKNKQTDSPHNLNKTILKNLAPIGLELRTMVTGIHDQLNLQTRQINVVKYAGEKPFKCEICSYASIDASSLCRHFRTHTSERPYKCEMCSYSCFSPLHWSQKGIRIDLDIDCNGLCSVVVAMLILGYLTEKVAWQADSALVTVQTSSSEVTMESQNSTRAPAWTEQEILDLIAVWGDESVLSELSSKRRNAKIFEKISKSMKDRGYHKDPQQCHVKLKELRQSYQKTQEANARSGSEPQTCRFYDELHAILGGAPTTTPHLYVDSCKEVSRNRDEDFGDKEDDSAHQASGETVLPDSQELFITLETVPSQPVLPDLEGEKGPLVSEPL